MALEALLEKLIVSLDANTAAHKGGAAATTTAKAGTTKTTEKKAETVDFEVVKKAASAVKEKMGSPVAKKIIKEAGKSDSLNATKPENYAPLLAALNKALEGEADEPDDDDDI